MRGRGAVSLMLLLLSWVALDDITTDNANEFPLEYTFLVSTGIWFTALSAWLVAKRHWFAGISSLVAVALGVVAFWSLPHQYQPPSLINYLGYVPLAWFVGLTVRLLAARSAGNGGRSAPALATPGALRAGAGDFRVPRVR